MALTNRQKEIKDLLDQGATPKQVGEKLGITENAVYQQRRRIKAAEGSAPKRSGGAKRVDESTRVRAEAARSMGRKRTPRQRPAAPTVSQPVATVLIDAADPLEAVRNRKAYINAELETIGGALNDAQEAYEAAQKAYSEAVGKVKPELEKLDAVEALLTGKLKPPPMVQKGKAEVPDPAPEATPAAEAAAQDEAAEAPDEPTEVPASENGSSEERPGVPTVPEFAQEDAFAS